jgi:hypothetical protein
VDTQILVDQPDHCIAIWHQTVIHIWRGAPTVPAISGMVKACNLLLASGEGNVTCLGIVERSSPPPEEAARAALARWSSDVVPKMAMAVFVADGSGFRSALVRGVGVALTTLMPHRIPFRFFGNLSEALDQLAPKLPPRSGGVLALRNVVEDLRAKAG